MALRAVTAGRLGQHGCYYLAQALFPEFQASRPFRPGQRFPSICLPFPFPVSSQSARFGQGTTTSELQEAYMDHFKPVGPFGLGNHISHTCPFSSACFKPVGPLRPAQQQERDAKADQFVVSS
jgi:hypothetical protein